MGWSKTDPNGQEREGFVWCTRLGKNDKSLGYWLKPPPSGPGARGGRHPAFTGGQPLETATDARLHRRWVKSMVKSKEVAESGEIQELLEEERLVVQAVVAGKTWPEAVRMHYPGLPNGKVYNQTFKLKSKLMPYVNMLQHVNLDDTESFDVMRERMLRSLLLNKQTKPNERLQVLREMAKIRESRKGQDPTSLIQQIELKTKEMLRLQDIRDEALGRGLASGADGGIERLAAKGPPTSAVVRGDTTSVAPVADSVG